MIAPHVDESSDAQWSPAEEVLSLAKRKAQAFATRFPNTLLLGSDTLINLEGQKIGKPGSFADAHRILGQLRGRDHLVLTAIAMLHPDSGMSFEWIESVKVRMRNFSDDELNAYAQNAEAQDKAGAYCLQGQARTLIEGLEGDYLGAVGLPLDAVARGLRQMGVPVNVNVDRIYEERNFLNWRLYQP
jgi:septum formation protein